MNLVLTSDLPSTANGMVFELMKATHPTPRVAWIPPSTETGRAHFPIARQRFESFGFSSIDYCDIDEDPDHEQLTRLDQYDVVYLSGGDPLGFRRNIARVGLGARLQQCLDAGRLIVAASGGSLQLTQNLSLYRLLTSSLDEVIAQREEYDALGVVDYELLPHLNRFDPPFLEIVRRYSEHVPNDIVALSDGSALLHESLDLYRCAGHTVRYRNGVATPIDAGHSR